jgi:hypothetical protein
MKLRFVGKAPPHREKTPASQLAKLSRSPRIKSGLLQNLCRRTSLYPWQLDVGSRSASHGDD